MTTLPAAPPATVPTDAVPTGPAPALTSLAPADSVPAAVPASLAAIADGQLAGFVSLMAQDYLVTRTAATASWLGVDFHGRGIGTAVRQVLCAFAFDHLDAEYLMSEAFADNHASLAVSRKLGYTEQARKRMARLGEPATSVELMLTRDRLVRYEHPHTVAGLAGFRRSIALDA